MLDASFDVFDLLARKTSRNCSTLVEIFTLDQTSQLGLFENLLHLAERKFDSVQLG